MENESISHDGGARFSAWHVWQVMLFGRLVLPDQSRIYFPEEGRFRHWLGNSVLSKGFPVGPRHAPLPATYLKGAEVWAPVLGGGLEWCYYGPLKIPNSGPILGEHRIYLGVWASVGPLVALVSFLDEARLFETAGDGKGLA